MTSKLLHVVKLGRPDLETLVSFIKIRVTKSNVDDWKKLKRGLTYVKNTITDKRIISEKTLSYLYTWIDVVYAVHNNMRVHTRSEISMGCGIIHGKALKQNINVKRSTEY